MKYLSRHTFDDSTALDDLSNSKANIAIILNNGAKHSLLELYKTYPNCISNPSIVTSKIKHLQVAKALLIAAYESPPIAILSLKKTVQHKLSPNVCPMCGSLKTGTADHYFPKEDYPEFSIYSWNLIPACDCNTKRNTALFGGKIDEWIIHPYYERLLVNRIITVTFDFSVGEPSLGIGAIYPAGIPSVRIDFHIDKIHRKTTMLDWVIAEWALLRELPCDAMTWTPSAPVTIQEVTNRLTELMNANDRKLGTPNNWASALFHGVISSPRAAKMVMEAVNRAI